MPVFSKPVVLASRAYAPSPVLPPPFSLYARDWYPVAVLSVPEVALLSASYPNALSFRWLEEGKTSAPVPKAVLV